MHRIMRYTWFVKTATEEPALPSSVRGRGKRIVLCADGTCNAFGQRSSNVAKLLEHLDLSDERVQVAAYDQGLGTRASQFAAIKKFRNQLARPNALHTLQPPNESLLRPWTWRALLNAMTRGSDLDAHVVQLYAKLAELYEVGDTVFMFGFSRGAFAVRALAGLTWRYGIPSSEDVAVAARFASAWSLFSTEFPDPDGKNKKRALEFQNDFGQRPCPIHFLGLWDTVKSYGGLEPVMLPHLRHNPSVCIVRHALALDERRAWFEPTTWGWLDSDKCEHAAASRLSSDDIAMLRKQDVAEVWFTGCHSDVGGGTNNSDTSEIAFRWMLGEARCAGLRLNDKGVQCLSVSRQKEEPRPTDSHNVVWSLIERVRRKSIDNGGAWPAHVDAAPGAVPREPLKSVRGSKLWVHESVTDLSRFAKAPEGVAVSQYPTRRLGHSSDSMG
jgi:uncharacterized protein (DUF2235 family)